MEELHIIAVVGVLIGLLVTFWYMHRKDVKHMSHKEDDHPNQTYMFKEEEDSSINSI